MFCTPLTTSLPFAIRWWWNSRTTLGWKAFSRMGSSMASVATLTPKAVSPLLECTETENLLEPAGRWVFVGCNSTGQTWKFLTHSDQCIHGKNVGKGEDFSQVVYCGVQKGMIDSSRLCNKGLTNRETVVTIWAGVGFALDLKSEW